MTWFPQVTFAGVSLFCPEKIKGLVLDEDALCFDVTRDDVNFPYFLSRHVGYLLVSKTDPDDNFKLLSRDYERKNALRNNQPNWRVAYLETRSDSNKRLDFFRLYPEHKSEANKMEEAILDLCGSVMQWITDNYPLPTDCCSARDANFKVFHNKDCGHFFHAACRVDQQGCPVCGQKKGRKVLTPAFFPETERDTVKRNFLERLKNVTTVDAPDRINSDNISNFVSRRENAQLVMTCLKKL